MVQVFVSPSATVTLLLVSQSPSWPWSGFWSGSWRNWTGSWKLIGLPLPTWKLKSVPLLVPPLLLTTTFFTIRVPGLATLLNVQVVDVPISTTIPETVAGKVPPFEVASGQEAPVKPQPVGILYSVAE